MSQSQESFRLGPRSFKITHHKGEGGSSLVDIHHRHAVDRVTQATGDCQSLPVKGHRLTWGKGLSSLLRRFAQVLERFHPRLSLLEVVSKNFIVISQPTCQERLHRLADPAMQLPSMLFQQRVVSHLLGKGVTKDVSHFGKEALFENQFGGLEFLQITLRPFAKVSQLIQQAMCELPADH